jgi:hypothetical protein
VFASGRVFWSEIYKYHPEAEKVNKMLDKKSLNGLSFQQTISQKNAPAISRFNIWQASQTHPKTPDC